MFPANIWPLTPVPDTELLIPCNLLSTKPMWGWINLRSWPAPESRVWCLTSEPPRCIKCIIKGWNPRNSQMEKAHRARNVERGMELPHPLQGTTLTALPCVQQPGSSLNPILLGFLYRLHHGGMMDCWLNFQPTSQLWKIRSGVERHGLVFLETCPHPGAHPELPH